MMLPRFLKIVFLSALAITGLTIAAIAVQWHVRSMYTLQFNQDYWHTRTARIDLDRFGGTLEVRVALRAPPAYLPESSLDPDPIDFEVWKLGNGPELGDFFRLNCNFSAESRVTGEGHRYRVVLPLWSVALVGLLMTAPAVWTLWTHCRARARQTHCRSCGYDLRATPTRCPECSLAVRPTDLSSATVR